MCLAAVHQIPEPHSSVDNVVVLTRWCIEGAEAPVFLVIWYRVPVLLLALVDATAAWVLKRK